MLLRIQGKKNKKLEIYNADLWGFKLVGREKINRYRLRVDGKWLDKQEGCYRYFTKWQIRDLLFRSIL